MKLLNKMPLYLCCFALSAFALTYIQQPHTLDFMAWFAWVPFVLVCRGRAHTGMLALSAYLVGLVYWLCTVYWVGYVARFGFIALSMYLACYWPILALAVRHLRCKNWPVIIAVPFLFVAAEAWQGVLITGFSWRLLAHSQFENLRIIQIADIFGSAGVSLVIALINGLIADLLITAHNKRAITPGMIIKTGIAGSILIACLIYGQFRIEQSRKYLKYGPVLGSVQPNIPSKVEAIADNGPEIMKNMLLMSNEPLNAGAEIVIWPETIVLASMNEDYLQWCNPESLPRIYDRALSKHTAGRGYLLLGAHAAILDTAVPEVEVLDRYNSAYLYTPEGKQEQTRYDKIHLVPFGEYIPLRKSFPLLFRFFEFLSHYEYEYDLTHGSEYTLFDIETSQGKKRFGVLICYEDTDARIARKMVYRPDGSKIDWLVNISNDGWYVKLENGDIIPSGELSQRTAISVFRAVENRVSLIRSVNSGISCLIDPVGRIKDRYIKGTLPRPAFERQAVEGWFMDRIILDSRRTVFGRIGNVIEIFLALAVLPVLLLTYWETSRRNKRKRSDNER